MRYLIKFSYDGSQYNGFQRLNKEKIYGCKTVFDIAPSYLSIKTNEELRATML